MYRKVVVGFDGGPCAGVALQEGMRMAAAGAGLLVVTVVPCQRSQPRTAMPPAALDAWHARDLLEQAGQHLARCGVQAELQLIDLGNKPDSNVAAEIVAVAAAAGADLIILGTHGRSGFRRFLLGHVAELVSRQAPCPILLVGLPAAADFSCLNPVELFGMWPDDLTMHADT